MRPSPPAPDARGDSLIRPARSLASRVQACQARLPGTIRSSKINLPDPSSVCVPSFSLRTPEDPESPPTNKCPPATGRMLPCTGSSPHLESPSGANHLLNKESPSKTPSSSVRMICRTDWRHRRRREGWEGYLGPCLATIFPISRRERFPLFPARIAPLRKLPRTRSVGSCSMDFHAILPKIPPSSPLQQVRSRQWFTAV